MKTYSLETDQILEEKIFEEAQKAAAKDVELAEKLLDHAERHLPPSPEKWWKSKSVLIIISIVSFAFLSLQNYYQGQLNAAIRDEQKVIRAENAELKHQTDAKQAYMNKGFIDRAKAMESEYFELRTFAQRIENHCSKIKTCDLPNDLTVLPQHREFESLEAILLK
jgi:hypothetical protein